MKKRILCLILAVTMCVSAICFTACNNATEVATVENEQSDTEVNARIIELQDGERHNIVLAMSTPRLLGAPISGKTPLITVDITATVSPSNASNKALTWAVQWSDDAPLKSSAISEYLSVDAATDTLSATLYCYKAFQGSNAVLLVTSQDSGVFATCPIIFDGVPTSMSIDMTGASTMSRGTVSNCYNLILGRTYDFDVSLSNVFGIIGDDYEALTASVAGNGTFTIGDYRTSVSSSSWTNETNVALSNYVNQCISVSIVNGKLRVQTLKRYESIYDRVVGGPSGAMTYGKYKQDYGRRHHLRND